MSLPRSLTSVLTATDSSAGSLFGPQARSCLFSFSFFVGDGHPLLAGEVKNRVLHKPPGHIESHMSLLSCPVVYMLM